MATVWILITTFIGWLLGWIFTDDHEIMCAFIGFVVGFMAGFIAPVDNKNKEH